jgi:hypothetical protein
LLPNGFLDFDRAIAELQPLISRANLRSDLVVVGILCSLSATKSGRPAPPLSTAVNIGQAAEVAEAVGAWTHTP